MHLQAHAPCVQEKTEIRNVPYAQHSIKNHEAVQFRFDYRNKKYNFLLVCRFSIAFFMNIIYF